MKVTKRTIQYALKVLDNQLLNCKEHPTNREQQAYYEGMYEMLEIICTQGFERLSYGMMQKDGTHYLPAFPIIEEESK